jgi:hypothetical protein
MNEFKVKPQISRMKLRAEPLFKRMGGRTESKDFSKIFQRKEKSNAEKYCNQEGGREKN